MSSDLLLDKDTHGLIIKDGDLVLVSGGDYVLQNVKQALSIFYGEWFLGRTRGVPYYQQIFKKNPDPSIVNSAFTRAILSVDGVKKVVKINVEINDNREANVTFQALTEFGLIRDSLEIVA